MNETFVSDTGNDKLFDLSVAKRKPISEFLHRKSLTTLDVPVYIIDLQKLTSNLKP